MYNDFRHIRREEWTFSYTGKDLLPFAKRILDLWSTQENNTRKEMAKLLDDRSVQMSDPRIKDLQQKIEHSATEAEKCSVFVHEFKRNPEATFILELGDVVYFGLINA